MHYHCSVDILIAVVVFGCALAGGFLGAVRLGAWALALAAAGLAGRWAGPAAAALLAGGGDPSPWAKAGGVALVAASTAVLVLVAGRGLRLGLETIRLGWVDRLGGSLVAGGTALALTALLLALAGEGGYSPRSGGAQHLQQVGRQVLMLNRGDVIPPRPQ